MKLRLDKYLCDMGIGTRQEAKSLVRNGLVQVNGATVKDAALKILIPEDTVICRGQEIEYVEYVYYIMNKPAGVLSATEDNHQKTVLDLMKDVKIKNLFPIGRLDKDTEGLLIITNDGMLAHDLLSPKKHVDKTYFVRTDSMLTTNHIQMVENGISLEEDFTTRPGKLVILSATPSCSECEITIHEGKFHQIKRMMHAMGNEVVYLKRISMGALTLPADLDYGEYRRMTDSEIMLLKGMGNV